MMPTMSAASSPSRSIRKNAAVTVVGCLAGRWLAHQVSMTVACKAPCPRMLGGRDRASRGRTERAATPDRRAVSRAERIWKRARRQLVDANDADDHDDRRRGAEVAGSSAASPVSWPVHAAARPRVACRMDRNCVPSSRPGKHALPEQDVGETDDERAGGEGAQRRERARVRRTAGEGRQREPEGRSRATSAPDPGARGPRSG